MCFLTGVNLVLWLLTAVYCVRVKSVAQQLQAGSEKDAIARRYRMYKENLLLTGKLFVLMGSCWLIYTFAIFVMGPDGRVPLPVAIIGHLIDLHGLWLLIILVFKPKKIYIYIRRKLGLKKSNELSNGTLSSQAHSTNISMTSVVTSISNSTIPATSSRTEMKEER
ncbi:unnamed protein product [Diatraea saccharalis]|uniref:G-protein coupled receptors family 1 profile domain-containing protein n=1 Tax=Diatraea saccharalis TaxID=40085 RepID=A0A9N9R702_9NEOP|nr:unnamed protein product [Diatraea saccharalis]